MGSEKNKMDVNNITITTYLLSGTFLLICISILRFYQNAFSYWKRRGLDFLEPTIPLGNIYNIAMRKCNLGEIFSQVYFQLKERGAKHGGMYLLWKPMYIPVDPEIIKNILIKDFENFSNRGLYFNEGNEDPLSEHIFNLEGTHWRNFRAKMPAAFTTSKMRKMFIIMEGMTKQLVQNLDLFAESGESINIKNEFSLFSTDIITSFAFGIKSHTMKHDNEELVKKGRYFIFRQWNLYKIFFVMLLPRYILQKVGFKITTVALKEYFEDMATKIVNLRKQKGAKIGDLMDILIRLTEKHEDEHDFKGKKMMKPLDFGEFIAHMCAFYAAGFETSSATQTFSMYEIARNPDCQAKLRQEINEVLKKYDGKVTYDAVSEMRYLSQVVDETLRLYPALPLLVRNSNNDYKIPGTDVTIEKNTVVVIPTMGIQRDPEYYPNPEKFNPEHFSNENKSKRSFVANLPFGEGPRMCVGKHMGLLLSKVGIITVVRNYDISVNKKTSTPLKFVCDELVLRTKGDIWINLKKIDSK